MRVPISEARNRFSALLDDVSGGAEITITRRGVPIAKLVSTCLRSDREKAQQVAADLRTASRGITLGGIGIKELIEEGRS